MTHRIAFLVLSLLCATISYATVTAATGTIALIKNLSMLQADGRLQGIMLLQMSVPFSNGCNWAWLSLTTDKETAATALAAKLSGAAVTIFYDNTIPSPWGETDICGANEIDLN